MKREEIIKLGLRTKQKRLEMGMTQAEFAEFIGIGFSTLQGLEVGKSVTIGKRVRGLVEKILTSSHHPCNEENDQILTSDFLIKIAKIIAEPDFIERVNGVAELLRISKEDAVFEILKKDLEIVT